MRKTKKCVVFGRTSSGKSTLINALLKEQVLPTSCGSTSTGFVVIQQKPIEHLKQLNNLTKACPLLSEDVVLIDTPGLDTAAFLDSSIKNHCSDADLIILVVNAMHGLSGTETEIFKRFKDIFSIVNVLIVFNFWDIVSEEEEPDLVKVQQTNNAKSLLCGILNYSEEKAKQNIYFISAKAQMKILINNNSNNSPPQLNPTYETFNKLFKDLKREMTEKSEIKKYNYLMELFTSVSDNFSICQTFLRALNIELEVISLCDLIFKSLIEISSELKTNEDCLSKSCIDFETKWNIGIDISNLSQIRKENTTTTLEILTPNLMRKSYKIVVLGRTSAGKSTFINCLFKKSILRSSSGSASNCFVSIQASRNNNNYIVVDDAERPVELLQQINDFHSSDRLENGSLINVFYSKETCPLLSEDVVLIDTPGLDMLPNLDECFKLHCLDANLIILVVNVTNELNGTETDFFNKFKDIFSQINVMIVFNFCDKFCDENEYKTFKTQQDNQAKTFLCDIINYNDKKANENVYFISAKERMDRLNNNLNCLQCYWHEANETWNKLFKDLERGMTETSVIRRYKYLMGIYTSVSDTFGACQHFIDTLDKKRYELFAKLNAELQDMSDIEWKINALVSQLYRDSFNDILIKGIEIVKMNLILELNERQMSDEHLRQIKLEELFTDSIGNVFSKIKTEIKTNFIHHDDPGRLILRTHIMDELYFKYLQDLEIECNNFDVQQVLENLKQISEHITAGIIATVVSTTVATCIIGALTWGVALVAEVAVLGVVGIGVGAGILLPFRSAWSEQVSNIKSIWISLETSLSNSYSTFTNDLLTHIDRLTLPMVDRSINLQNKLNTVRDDLVNLSNYSLSNRDSIFLEHLMQQRYPLTSPMVDNFIKIQNYLNHVKEDLIKLKNPSLVV